MSPVPVVVGLIQITVPLERLYYLPYTIGVLQTYAQAHAEDPSRYRFLAPVYLREPIPVALERLSGADVVGFSVYIWNIGYSLSLAAALKAARPETLIVFGGPQVPDLAEAFLRAHPFIDVVASGEGEQTFLRLLERFPDRDWDQIPGLSWLDTDGNFESRGKAARVTALDDIPSPYLSGVFDPIMEQDPTQRWIAIWETNRGCPFSCSFCDWGTIKSKVYRYAHSRVLDEIDWFGRKGIEMLWSSDANFGMLPRDLEFADALVETNKRYGFPRKTLLQMTKNQAERTHQTFKRLADAGMLTAATMSLQSVTPAVLKAIKRDNISLEVYHELLKRFVSDGIPTYTELLIGLPGETYESFIEGIDAVITRGQHEDLRFYNALLLPNAEMSDPAYRAAHGIEAVLIPTLSPNTAVRSYLDQSPELVEMIVATNSMPRADWVRMRALSWMTQLMYYGGLLQLPLLLLQQIGGLRHRDLLEAFFEGPLPGNAVVLPQIRAFLHHKARELMAGQPEVNLSKDPATGTPIWLTSPDFVLNGLLYGPLLNQAYSECHALLENLVRTRHIALPEGLLIESLVLAQSLFQSAHPAWGTFRLTLNYNLWDCFRKVLVGQPPALSQGRYEVSRQPDASGNWVVSEVRAGSLDRV